MQRMTDIDRAAVLLNALGDEAIETSLAAMEAERAQSIRERLRQMAESPPSQEDIDFVLDDFETFFRFAIDTMKSSSVLSDLASGHDSRGDEVETAADGHKTELKIYEPSDEPVEDLRRLKPAQICGAVAHEHPKTIALVLGCLDHAVAASVLDLLPTEIQSDVFFAMKSDKQAPADLVDRVVKTTVVKGYMIEPSQVNDRDDDQKIADFLRELPKATRKRMMSQLEERDPDTAARLQNLMYVFDDLLIYDNRSIQKLLGQVDTQTLVVALEGADEVINRRILENLSKRAASALQEEMDFKQTSSEEEVVAARQQVAQVIGQLDAAGELNLQ